MRLSCPICGERDLREFAYRGSAKLLARPAAEAPAEAWHDYLNLRDNPEGPNAGALAACRRVPGLAAGGAGHAGPCGARGRAGAGGGAVRRLAAGGRIDRGRTLRLSFDGKAVAAHPGDTLASALLAAGVSVVGRSFKYHRPRGVLAAGSEEPNALVTVGGVPNVRATVQEAYDGLAAVSQNRWPSLGLDVMAVSDSAAPLIGAGFYYKTFMWPPAWWERVYEPLIRRAAGLGALSGAAPDRCEKAFGFCDLLVIGAGPAGLMAALVAGRAGARVILADEDFVPGGRLVAERIAVGGQEGADWAAGVWGELAAMPNVRLMPRTTVTGVHDGGTWGALERVGEHRAAMAELPRACFWRIVARRAVLAAGALERPIAFPGNDRPGVMLAGAVRAWLNRWSVAPARAAVFTACDDGWRTAADLAAAGVEVAAIVDARAERDAAGGAVAGAGGGGGGGDARADGLARDQRAAGGGGRADRGRLPGGRRRLEPGGAAELPPRRAAGLGRADRGLRAGGRGGAGAGGRRRGGRGLLDGGGAQAGGRGGGGRRSRRSAFGRPRVEVPEAEDRAGAVAAFWRVEAPGRAWVDFQNDVTVKDLALAAREGFGRAEHAKRYTTLGMATDQGKVGGVVGSGVLAALTGRGVAETGVTTFRPPYVPVPIAALGAGAEGDGLAPRRLTPAHAVAAGMGAGFVEAGLWMRASHFPRGGRGLAGGLRPRGGDGAGHGRGVRRVDARQARGLRAGCGGRFSIGSMPTGCRRWRSGGCATARCCARTASCSTTARSPGSGRSGSW